MTLIVSDADYASKAQLKTNLDKGILVHEPSVISSWVKDSRELPVGFSDTVTNGAARTKFAKITKQATGWKVQ
jgi:hypothetical protein